MNQKAHIACNFNSLIETEGRLKVTGSHVHGESGNISETRKTETLLLQTGTEYIEQQPFRSP